MYIYSYIASYSYIALLHCRLLYIYLAEGGELGPPIQFVAVHVDLDDVSDVTGT